ncbi:MAG: terminase [Treponema sp.]|nr:terminase [Treponema sp.]
MNSVEKILNENAKRLERNGARFDPITGEGSIGKRYKWRLDDFPIKDQWLPWEMRGNRLLQKLRAAGSIAEFCRTVLHKDPDDETRRKIVEAIVRLRCRYDFAFWAAMFIYIKPKGGGENLLFRLSRPQRAFVEKLEELRKARKPIRIIMLKARQWGGSTTTQIYMAWLQLIHAKGLNSLIIAHHSNGSIEIKDMFDRLLKPYPIEMLHEPTDIYSPNEKKLEGVGRSGQIHRVPQRNCKIKIGTAENPDACRGGDYSLVHLSEVGLWPSTESKSPEDIVRSACSGVLFRPNTLIVYESTANGTGDFFHTEYMAAKNHDSQFRPVFVSWFDIDEYSLPFDSDEEREEFARHLWERRGSTSTKSNREEPGTYIWSLWEMGATLEAINWYINERRGKDRHDVMASEYPSNDIEAFVNSGQLVFAEEQIAPLRKGVCPPVERGELYGREESGAGALEDIRFVAASDGSFCVWDHPDPHEPDTMITDRYLTVVDVGGRGRNADWSVILVLDRVAMIDGGEPAVVAQWRGHCDIDILAWHAARIAKYYDNSLLVIESNTLETHDKTRIVDGDQSLFILNQIRDVYDNLYARPQSPEEVINRSPRRYGFHTNTSTKPMIISNLIRCVRERAWIERDEQTLTEFLQYERKKNGAYGAIAKAHDDLLMTRAIGLHICFYEMAVPREVNLKETRPQRREQRLVGAADIF